MSDVRLIDANELKAKLYSLLKIEEAPPMFIEGLETALAVADVAPTIDAVQVVRCRECVFRGQHDLCPMNIRVYMLDEVAYLDCTEDDGFCHKGEKMDGGATDGSDN